MDDQRAKAIEILQRLVGKQLEVAARLVQLMEPREVQELAEMHVDLQEMRDQVRQILGRCEDRYLQDLAGPET